MDTSGFVLKIKYDADKSELEKIVFSSLFKKADYNSKITEIEGTILDVISLAIKTGLTTVENKIPDFSSLVKKTDYHTKITEIEKKLTDHDHNKYIATPEFNS